MRDLYARARLPRYAAPRSIEKVLPRLSPSDRQAIEMILLDARRRAIYDRTHAVVEEIGRVRAILGERVADLNRGPHYTDFIFKSPRAGERHKENHGKPRRRASRVAIVVLTVLVVSAGITTYLTTSEARFDDRLPEPPAEVGSTPHTQVDAYPESSRVMNLPPAKGPILRDGDSQISHSGGTVTHLEGRNPPSNTTATAPTIPQPEPLALPLTGTVSSFGDGVAPFRILVPHGDSHYYVKLERGFGRSVQEFGRSTDVITLFIRSGESVETKVPLGQYILKYAEGTQWYGIDSLFGDSTTYYRADVVFVFSSDGEYYVGHTVELIPQSSGNLDTNRIVADEF